MITISHSIEKKMKRRFQSLTQIGRQFQSLERKVYADWFNWFHSPSATKELPYMANNDEHMDEYLCPNFLSASIFGLVYHSRYQKFELTEKAVSRSPHMQPVQVLANNMAARRNTLRFFAKKSLCMLILCC